MICYLIRHGKDDDTVRGGWSDTPLTEEGIAQIHRLSLRLAGISNMRIGRIYTSDLRRARQTADILSGYMGVPVTELPEFRETNNGVLAGMKNELAAKQYPGLYWSALEWDTQYPEGESPHEFFDRILKAWQNFKMMLRDQDMDVALVTHGGVLNVIQCIENDTVYTNKTNPYPIGNGEMVCVKV